jgi:hypothetical protein
MLTALLAAVRRPAENSLSVPPDAETSADHSPELD